MAPPVQGKHIYQSFLSVCIWQLCVLLFVCVYQYGGNTQGLVSQRVRDVGRLASVRLCHIQTAGRIPCSNLWNNSASSLSHCLQEDFKASWHTLSLNSKVIHHQLHQCVTHLFQPLLLQTDDIQVEICPQSIGLVEENTSCQPVPVSLQTEAHSRII